MKTAVLPASALEASAPAISPRADDGADGRALSALVAGAILIGAGPICVRLSTVGPSATAFWRALLAAPILVTWAWATSRHEPGLTRQQRRLMLAAGLLFAADLAIWHWSFRFASVALATLVSNAAPVFVALGERALFGRRLTSTFLAGLAVALVGMTALVSARGALTGGRGLGYALALVSAVLYAGYLLIVKSLGPRVRPERVTAWTSVICSFALLPVAALSHEVLVPADARGWTAVAALALLAQILGQTLITTGLGRLPASFSAVTLLLQPVVTAALAWALLAEPLTAWQIGAAAVVLAGIVLARRGSIVELKGEGARP